MKVLYIMGTLYKPVVRDKLSDIWKTMDVINLVKNCKWEDKDESRHRINDAVRNRILYFHAVLNLKLKFCEKIFLTKIRFCGTILLWNFIWITVVTIDRLMTRFRIGYTLKVRLFLQSSRLERMETYRFFQVLFSAWRLTNIQMKIKGKKSKHCILLQIPTYLLPTR